MTDEPTPAHLALPANTAQAEEAFVKRFRDGELTDVESFAELVTHAMQSRRPRLAARLVQLLPEHVEIAPGSALERAQKAAGFLVLDASDVELYNALDEAWREVRRSRMRRMLRRQRTVGRNEQYTIPRVGRRSRKR